MQSTRKLNQAEAGEYLASLYKTISREGLRLGQAILNDHPEKGPCPDIYYSKDDAAVVSWFYANFVE